MCIGSMLFLRGTFEDHVPTEYQDPEPQTNPEPKFRFSAQKPIGYRDICLNLECGWKIKYVWCIFVCLCGFAPYFQSCGCMSARGRIWRCTNSACMFVLSLCLWLCLLLCLRVSTLSPLALQLGVQTDCRWGTGICSSWEIRGRWCSYTHLWG